ncbi:hypothetical protein PA598K_01797 [Paenibacillus sp. 598K]|uniref:hypothetical protein n=1 Tax=Paenibacillus sp. 598K TaxID=1117987 RepID=UPI000FF92727|nr:hypothetical protein [Paenibacillus sp. 598K]GBF73504.1 hypothetical protein PA598K_01797 [Paenibacillus sp. 598K]
MPIKSGFLSDYLTESNASEKNFFLSSSVIDQQPSTKPRDEGKRAMVLAMEIEELRRNFPKGGYPKANKNRGDRWC